MRLFKILAVLSLPLLLVGCPPKAKVLYLKVLLGKDLKTEKFLEQIGNKIEAPLADEKVGFKFLPDQCEHRQYKSDEERSLLGSCLINKEVYIYALVADHGPNPQEYIGDPDFKETLSLIDRYKNNLNQLLDTLEIPVREEGYFVEEKLEFMKMLESKSREGKTGF